MYLIKTPLLLKKLYPNHLIWNKSREDKSIFLTFDDGPIPIVTPWVLKTLKKFNAKATFFCIGENIEKNQDIFLQLKADGHAIGNHTYNHVKGWNTSNKTYLKEVEKCEEIMQKVAINNLTSKLFRPPYGKIKKAQSKVLRKLGYKIVMWDVLSADFDQSITPEKCLENVTKNVKSGSVIVFHDSIKASQNLKFALPKTLHFLKENGYQFDIIH